MPTLVEAQKKGRIAKVIALSRNSGSSYDTRGAQVVHIDYAQPTTLLKALEGVDILISTMGTKGNYEECKAALLDAAIKSKVKVYLPSEFGTDHNHIGAEYANFPMFESKQVHFRKAQAAGIKTVGIYIALIMEFCFFKRSGFDNEREEWRIVGDGKSTKLSVTSLRDVGPITLEAALLAYHDPARCPDHCRVASATHTLRDIAAIFDQAANSTTSIHTIDLAQRKAEFEEQRKSIPQGMLGPLIPILMAEGSFDHTKDSAVPIINGGKWPLRTMQDYAQEVHGRPFKHKQPFE